MSLGSHNAAEVESLPETIEVPSFDGLKLVGRWWRRGRSRGTVVVAHGFGEHGGTYGRFAGAIGRALDLEVVAVDFRGHGRSQGSRGVVGGYDELVGDLRAVLGWLDRAGAAEPRFVLGHSNGGQVALRLALEHPAGVRGFLFSNPALKIALPIPRATILLGRFLLAFFPWFTIKGRVQTELLTHDPALRRELAADPLRHTRVSAPLFFGMIEGGAMVSARAAEITEPLLMILGGEDPVIEPTNSREVFERFGSLDKTLLYYPRMLHEPFNETGRERVFEDVVRWLEPRLG